MDPAAGAFADEARQHIVLQHYVHAGEIADFVAYPVSPGVSFMTGADWPSTEAMPPDPGTVQRGVAQLCRRVATNRALFV